MSCLLILIALSHYFLISIALSASNKRVNVVYFDKDIIVAEKPHNMLSVPGVSSDESMAGEIAKIFQIDRVDKCIVHRLDYATSGIMIFARSLFALQDLHTQFRSSAVLKKSYVAIVHGVMDSYEGEISLPLGRDKDRGNPFCKVDTLEGKPSETKWKLLDSNSKQSLLELVPITGRTHQLRLHLAAINHPIIGDLLYFPTNPEIFAKRLMLHAANIRFEHPLTRELMTFYAPAPFSL